ncbi:MAG: penicillin amidase, partial [Woeseiaceae bacterium]
MRLLKRWLIRIFVASLAMAAIVAMISWWLLSGSLPVLDGELSAGSIAAAVTIERDDAGIPVISAENRGDLAYATGFVHAQDRFFQMDLTRRKAAGELAE